MFLLLCFRYCVFATFATVFLLLCFCYCVFATVFLLLCFCYCVFATFATVFLLLSRSERQLSAKGNYLRVSLLSAGKFTMIAGVFGLPEVDPNFRTTAARFLDRGNVAF